MPNLIPVAFHGDTIDTIREDGRVWIIVRRVADSLGLDYPTQFSKLKNKEWATVGLWPTVAADGRNREVFCLDLDGFPMWLATIDASAVAEHVRPKLVAYQREAARVLRDHFFPRTTAPEHTSARAALPDLCARALSEGDYETAHHLTGFLAGRRLRGAARGEQLGLDFEARTRRVAAEPETHWSIARNPGLAAKIVTWLDTVPPRAEVLTDDACAAVGVPCTRSMQMLVGTVMSEHGWARARLMRDGVRRWMHFRASEQVYTKPATPVGGLDS